MILPQPSQSVTERHAPHKSRGAMDLSPASHHLVVDSHSSYLGMMALWMMMMIMRMIAPPLNQYCREMKEIRPNFNQKVAYQCLEMVHFQVHETFRNLALTSSDAEVDSFCKYTCIC